MLYGSAIKHAHETSTQTRLEIGTHCRVSYNHSLCSNKSTNTHIYTQTDRQKLSLPFDRPYPYSLGSMKVSITPMKIKLCRSYPPLKFNNSYSYAKNKVFNSLSYDTLVQYWAIFKSTIDLWTSFGLNDYSGTMDGHDTSSSYTETMKLKLAGMISGLQTPLLTNFSCGLETPFIIHGLVSCTLSTLVIAHCRSYPASLRFCYSLKWKDRVCHTVKKASVCLPVTGFWNNGEICYRWDSKWQVLLLRSSRISLFLLIDHSRAFFSLARCKIGCCDSLDSIASLSVENTVLIHQVIFWLIVDFISIGERCLIDFLFLRSGCSSVQVSKRLSLSWE